MLLLGVESGGGVCSAKRLLELIVVQDFGILMIQLEGTKLVGFMSLFFET